MGIEEKLVFAVNGRRFELSNVDPSTTLLEFLRTETPFKGAKLGCGEGGCGACVVLLSKYDPLREQVEGFSVSSCLTLLCSINQCSITTTEGLGNSKDGFHSIHQRISGFHASQCGFCTPGMCMSLFSALINADKTERLEPPTGFSKITMSEAEKAIAGNLCRCTGYRPIADVCKSFAADVDMEDLGLNSFFTKRENIDKNPNGLPFYCLNEITTFPDFLKNEIKSSASYFSDLQLRVSDKETVPLEPTCKSNSKTNSHWYSPSSVEELKELLKSEGPKNGERVKLVVGNTGAGVYKEVEHYNKYIDLRQVPELLVIKRDSSGVEIGAAVTISRAIEALTEEDNQYGSNERLVFKKIADHMRKVASQFVRNMASLGGNLIMAQRNQFESDIATILLAAGSSVNILTGLEMHTLTMEEFLEEPPCDSKTILVSVHIPSWNQTRNFYSKKGDLIGYTSAEERNVLFETYRSAARPLGNAVAYLNAAFLAQVSTHAMSESFVLESIRLAFGAYGTKHAIRARKVEEFLTGKSLNASVLFEAIKLLLVTVVPEVGTPNPAYRSSLAVGYLFYFLHPFVKGVREHVKDLHMQIPNGSINAKNPTNGFTEYLNASTDKACMKTGYFKDKNDHVDRSSLLLSGKQVVDISGKYRPVGEPTRKVGEAVYVDDIPSPKDCLHGAFICSTKPLARVKGIEFKSTPASRRISTVISVKDIPKGGMNIGSKAMFGSEPLFAEDVTLYAGQPLGFVIADTQRYANMAANQAIVDYDMENLEPPILTVEEAVERSSFFEVPPVLQPKQVGDFSIGMAEADHKILSAKIELGSQYYFYLETQTALAVPDEDNCIVVYSSCQCPENAQEVIAKCLGIPDHNVRVITRRVGGGFGGKALRAIPVATACALAAYKLRCPVRAYLDRKTDMIMAGGRHPMKIDYSVGFKSDGKITALNVDILINAGISTDISPIMPWNMVEALKKYNWGALSFDIKVCKTNHSSKSAMRAPGEVQASFIAEAVIEHVASSLSMDADCIRKRNLHTFESLQLFYDAVAGELNEYTLPSLLDNLAASSSFHHRTEMVKQFNSHNKWRKRGISRMPIIYEVSMRPTPGKVSILNDSSIVVEVGGIELGQGLWTKVRQMTAFALNQLCNDESQDLLNRVRVIQADTLSLVQGGYTAGSTTSECSCEAVRLACNVLVERLMPLRERLQEQMGAISWETVIRQANLQSVNLSASTLWVPNFSSMRYLNYGAAVSEVEIDLLTGATTILRTDIIYDCGQSLNPAVDLGQVEGAFVQGLGFFMLEDYKANPDGLVVTDGTWTYKIPTVDTIPRQFNVELLNSGHHQERVLSSKASGEPPLLLANSVHCATREAIKEARKDHGFDGSAIFQLKVPATMPVVKELCGLDNVERYLENLLSHQ
ncbi:Aldehyde oxidase/xanthine dehydrogenase [Cinnamomum micranthum f. kanehirae]|uniref:Aldehyde oxidase/xanthine dehydrogenase n=1 Tax=Cinnamomum micranthum f. kanehirae TaxID=337451 RepID=A0A443P3W9_9MAGN|nr:Aldehyde oxidase/xanthine dehydrogenase [Cinnamomum micranthum f. kanehirae]